MKPTQTQLQTLYNRLKAWEAKQVLIGVLWWRAELAESIFGEDHPQTSRAIKLALWSQRWLEDN